MEDNIKQESDLEKIIKEINKGSDFFVEEMSPILRPLGKIFYIILFTIVYIILSPFYLLYTALGFEKKKNIAFDRLYEISQDIAYEGNIEEAIGKLESVKDKLKNSDAKKIVIEPYGKFDKIDDYLKIISYLYRLYTYYDDWESADTICDELLDDMDVYESKEAVGFEIWIKRKAKCIVHLKSKAKAEEFLLGYVKPDNDKYEINLFLYELRENEK